MIKLDLQLFGEEDGFTGEVVDSGTDSEDIIENPEAETGGDDDSLESGVADQKVKQTPEQNAAFAEMRRKSEAAEAKAKKADDLIAAQYGKSHGIYTVEQYEQALAQQQAEEQARALEEAGIDPNLINGLVDKHPIIQAAKQQIDRQKAADTETWLKTAHSELIAEYPELKENIKTFNDLDKLPGFEAIDKKVAQGYSLLDAYESVNRSTLRKRSADAAKQKTLNNLNSKSHLATEGDGASDGLDVHVPNETLQMYMDMGMDKKSAIAYHKKIYG